MECTTRVSGNPHARKKELIITSSLILMECVYIQNNLTVNTYISTECIYVFKKNASFDILHASFIIISNI
jgi:hypothetical protein